MDYNGETPAQEKSPAGLPPPPPMRCTLEYCGFYLQQHLVHLLAGEVQLPHLLLYQHSLYTTSSYIVMASLKAWDVNLEPSIEEILREIASIFK